MDNYVIINSRFVKSFNFIGAYQTFYLLNVTLKLKKMKNYLKYYDCRVCKCKTPHTLHFNSCTPFNQSGAKIVGFFLSCNKCKTLQASHASLRLWCEWTGDTVQEVFDKIKPIPNSNEAY